MVAAVTVFTNDITDVFLSGQSSPSVQAENLCVLRRHDPDDPTDGLLLMLTLLDPSGVGTMDSGTFTAGLSDRSGGGPLSRAERDLDDRTGRSNPTLAQLLGSRSISEMRQSGGPAFTGSIESLPSGLTLQTVFDNDGVDYEVRFQTANPVWKIWGYLYGQDFADSFNVDFQWQAAN